MKPASEMTDLEIVQSLRDGSLRSRIRAVIYHGAALLEQADAQRRPPSSVERRRMELKIAEEIMALVGVKE